MLGPIIYSQGYDTIYLASALDLKVLGIDISETAIERARA